MDYIYILVSIDADSSFNSSPRDVSHHRTEEGAVNVIPREPVDFLKMERTPFNFSDETRRITVRDFAYYQVDKVALTD